MQSEAHHTNKVAFAAYVLGFCSLFPGLGFPFTVPAVVLGIVALRKVRINPGVGGRADARTAIILGASCFSMNLFVLTQIASSLARVLHHTSLN